MPRKAIKTRKISSVTKTTKAAKEKSLRNPSTTSEAPSQERGNSMLCENSTLN
jgi:hypothetical protein